jgi:hypothetical protein
LNKAREPAFKKFKWPVLNVLIYNLSMQNSHNAQCINVGNKNVYVLHIWVTLCCFLPVEVMDSSMEMTIPWMLGHACQPTSNYLWLCLMGILGLKPVLNILAPSLRRWDTNMAAVFCVFILSFRMLCMDPGIPDMVATSQLGFVFSSVLLISGCLRCLESTLLGHTCFERQWHWKTCVVPVICCPEASLNISEVRVVSFPI